MKYTKPNNGESQGYELPCDCVTEIEYIKTNFSPDSYWKSTKSTKSTISNNKTHMILK